VIFSQYKILRELSVPWNSASHQTTDPDATAHLFCPTAAVTAITSQRAINHQMSLFSERTLDNLPIHAILHTDGAGCFHWSLTRHLLRGVWCTSWVTALTPKHETIWLNNMCKDWMYYSQAVVQENCR